MLMFPQRLSSVSWVSWPTFLIDAFFSGYSCKANLPGKANRDSYADYMDYTVYDDHIINIHMDFIYLYIIMTFIQPGGSRVLRKVYVL